MARFGWVLVFWSFWSTGPALFDLASQNVCFRLNLSFVAVHKSAKCKVAGILRQLPQNGIESQGLWLSFLACDTRLFSLTEIFILNLWDISHNSQSIFNYTLNTLYSFSCGLKRSTFKDKN